MPPRLRTCYLRKNRTKVSWWLVARAVAALLVGILIAVAGVALIEAMLADRVSPGILKVVSNGFRIFTSVMLMGWISRWDDRPRFARFLKQQRNHEKDST